MYRTAFGRAPAATRSARLPGIPCRSGDPPARPTPDDVRVWADLAHALFNVKEFIYLK